MADTGIRLDWEYAKRINGQRPDICEWLAQNKHRYSVEAVKKTEKAWGCRHSRTSKDKGKKK